MTRRDTQKPDQAQGWRLTPEASRFWQYNLLNAEHRQATPDQVQMIMAISRTKGGREYLAFCGRIQEHVWSQAADLDLSGLPGKSINALWSLGSRLINLLHTLLPKELRSPTAEDWAFFVLFPFWLALHSPTPEEALDDYVQAITILALYRRAREEALARFARLPLTVKIFWILCPEQLASFPAERLKQEDLLRPFHVLPSPLAPPERQEEYAERALVFFEELKKLRQLPFLGLAARALDMELEYLPHRLKSRMAARQRAGRWLASHEDGVTVVQPPQHRPRKHKVPREPSDQEAAIRPGTLSLLLEYIPFAPPETKPEALTRTQAEALREAFGPKAPAIVEYLRDPAAWGTADFGPEKPPTQREIARRVGLKTDRQVRNYLQKFADRKDKLLEILAS